MVQGFPVPPSYIQPGAQASGAKGRWEILVRMIGTAPPGPWSEPNPFKLIFQETQSTQPVTSKPSALQIPKQSFGATTGLIHPRGVGDKSAKKETEPVDTTPERQKKS